jgi:exonuclease SbcD
MKFIHTSDWHIGRQFHNVSLLEDQRHVLNQLLDYIKTEKVDAVVIAGDIYDRSIPPASAVDLLDQVLTAITMDLGVPVILIPGNHDSAQRVRFGSKQLKKSGLHIMGDLSAITETVVIA